MAITKPSYIEWVNCRTRAQKHRSSHVPMFENASDHSVSASGWQMRLTFKHGTKRVDGLDVDIKI
ncbi:MAG: hypothetical protein ACM3SR_00455 [Ignavibacteriales bacterium]